MKSIRDTPVGILEESLAQCAADTFWRLQRAQNYETAVLNHLINKTQNPDDPDDSSIENRTSKIENPRSLLGQVLFDDFQKTHCLEKILKYEMSIERSYYRTLKELRRLQSLRLNNVGEASPLRCNSENSKKEQNKANLPQNKPKIPPFDPVKLYDNIQSSSTGLDPLTKIMMKIDRDRQLTKKAM